MVGSTDFSFGTAKAKDAQGTPIQSHISPSVLVYEEKNGQLDCSKHLTTYDLYFRGVGHAAGWQAILKLTCWVCNTNLSTYDLHFDSRTTTSQNCEADPRRARI